MGCRISLSVDAFYGVLLSRSETGAAVRSGCDRFARRWSGDARGADGGGSGRADSCQHLLIAVGCAYQSFANPWENRRCEVFAGEVSDGDK